ncbi:MAG: aminotransferase class V-fold PLP-dependent enzyme [Nitrospirae bacterium]|nr:aminotransferase class V-fold PLP-dependent enzyme [Nitrospirota bacterium]
MFTFFSPNSNYKDAFRALGMFFRPWSWRKGPYPELVEKKMAKILGVDTSVDRIHCFDSGRTALHEALNVFGVGEGDEVIVQAFTCVVVTNAVKFTGAKTVFADIEEGGYNMDVENLKKKITDKTKAIIVQHTFGIPADIDGIMKIAEERGVKVVEDCAHGIWKGFGLSGDAAIYSFGVEKAVSSVRGGALYLKNKDIENPLPHLPLSIILKHLLHPIFFSIGKTFYRTFGKALLYFSKNSGLTAKIIEQKEKKGKKVPWFPARFPNALAYLAYNQLDLLDEFNKHREEISSYYQSQLTTATAGSATGVNKVSGEGLKLLRYPVRYAERGKIMSRAKNGGVFLGNWYDSVVAPRDTDLSETGYVVGSCPRAEKLTKEIINLPTGREVSLEMARKIISFLE